MDIGNIISYTWPTAQFSVGETYESLQWFSEDIPKPTEQQIIEANPTYIQHITLNSFLDAIEALLDSTAQIKNYKNQFSVLTYINSTNEIWKSEALVYNVWRDAVWEYAYQEFAKFQSGERPMPTIADFIAELPLIQWPS